MTDSYDLVIIGGGPAGYTASLRAAQLGWRVACVEKEPKLGGTCLRVGCIPSKALLESSERFVEAGHGLAAHGIVLPVAPALDLPRMMGRKDAIVQSLASGIELMFKKRQVVRVLGHGRLDGLGRVQVDGPDGTTTLTTKHVLIATGSEPSPLPGVALDLDRIGTSTEALAYPEVPGHLVVIGAGVIGLELGSVWRRLGARVTVLEYLPRILPGIDSDVARRAEVFFKRQGLTFELGVKVTGTTRDGDGCRVTAEGREPLACDRVLLCVGRRPFTAGLGLDTVGIALDPRGRIPIGAHFETSAPGVFAVGDVVAGAMLAHKAEEEAVACVEHLVTGVGHVDYNLIPNVVYTSPEIASVGKTEDELKDAGVPYRKGSSPFAANGRAKAFGHTDGFVKVLAHQETDRLLGVHVIGPWASELIAEAATAMAFGASSEDLARTCHAHPTLAEVLKDAALAVDGRPLSQA